MVSLSYRQTAPQESQQFLTSVSQRFLDAAVGGCHEGVSWVGAELGSPAVVPPTEQLAQAVVVTVAVTLALPGLDCTLL